MKAGYQKYKTTSVQSASKEKILLMLYEGAIRFMKQAIVAIDRKDIAARGMNVGRAFDIVMELNNTLNHEVGGDLAKNLEQLYMFVTDQLTQANIKNDKVPLQHALKTMETLYQGWVEAVEKIKREEAAKG
jgi:flagellar secretion chaperone FliS